jgi:hypothetical protein
MKKFLLILLIPLFSSSAFAGKPAVHKIGITGRPIFLPNTPAVVYQEQSLEDRRSLDFEAEQDMAKDDILSAIEEAQSEIEQRLQEIQEQQ